jgi:hypothetical protein
MGHLSVNPDERRSSLPMMACLNESIDADSTIHSQIQSDINTIAKKVGVTSPADCGKNDITITKKFSHTEKSISMDDETEAPTKKYSMPNLMNSRRSHQACNLIFFRRMNSQILDITRIFQCT